MMADEKKAEKSRDTLLRESYSAAERRLREKYPDEFNALRSEEAKSRGIEWSPPKSDKQKAQDTVNELLAKYPDLAVPPGKGGVLPDLDAPKGPADVPITGTPAA